MYCSHSNWHPATPEGNEKRIHDSYPNNNSLRIQIYWGKLPPPDSQADSCEEEGPSRKQINKNNHNHPLFAYSWSLFSVCLLWFQPCWLVLTNRKMVKSNNFFMPEGWRKVRLAALLVSQLLWIHTKGLLNSPVKKVFKLKGQNHELPVEEESLLLKGISSVSYSLSTWKYYMQLHFFFSPLSGLQLSIFAPKAFSRKHGHIYTIHGKEGRIKSPPHTLPMKT